VGFALNTFRGEIAKIPIIMLMITHIRIKNHLFKSRTILEVMVPIKMITTKIRSINRGFN